MASSFAGAEPGFTTSKATLADERSLLIPEKIQAGDKFRVQVEVESTVKTNALLQLYTGGRLSKCFYTCKQAGLRHKLFSPCILPKCNNCCPVIFWQFLKRILHHLDSFVLIGCKTNTCTCVAFNSFNGRVDGLQETFIKYAIIIERQGCFYEDLIGCKTL